MNLHENKSTFEQYIIAAADFIGISNTDIVEKDYFVTYFLEGATATHSRHIYDLYKIFPEILFDNNFARLIEEVRELRKPHKKSISAQDGVDIPELLRNIVKTDAFKSDYDQITSLLLFEDVAYNEAIDVLEKIADLECF